MGGCSPLLRATTRTQVVVARRRDQSLSQSVCRGDTRRRPPTIILLIFPTLPNQRTYDISVAVSWYSSLSTRRLYLQRLRGEQEVLNSSCNERVGRTDLADWIIAGIRSITLHEGRDLKNIKSSFTWDGQDRNSFPISENRASCLRES